MLRMLRNVRDEIYFKCYIYFFKKVQSELYINYLLTPVRYFF